MSQVPPVEVAHSVAFEEFLVSEELSELVGYVHSRHADFRPSEVVVEKLSDPNEPYRRSLVLLETGPLYNVISDRIRFYLPRILRALEHRSFDVTWIEAQITASNDGDYFRLHNDNTQADAPSREITYVFYFHREPRPFQGGELVIHDSCMENGCLVSAGIRQMITPAQNEIIFFPSSCLHEIYPVVCPSGDFHDSRFTFNGWIHC